MEILDDNIIQNILNSTSFQIPFRKHKNSLIRVCLIELVITITFALFSFLLIYLNVLDEFMFLLVLLILLTIMMGRHTYKSITDLVSQKYQIKKDVFEKVEGKNSHIQGQSWFTYYAYFLNSKKEPILSHRGIKALYNKTNDSFKSSNPYSISEIPIPIRETKILLEKLITMPSKTEIYVIRTYKSKKLLDIIPIHEVTK